MAAAGRDTPNRGISIHTEAVENFPGNGTRSDHRSCAAFSEPVSVALRDYQLYRHLRASCSRVG